MQWIGAIRCNSAGCSPLGGDVLLREAGALADNPKRSVARDSLRALAERMAEECRLEQPLAEACELKFRVWEAGRRTEDWRLIVVRRGSGREYQVRTWADWERIKQLAGDWSTRSS